MKRCYYHVTEMVVLALDSTARLGSCAVLREAIVLAARTSDPAAPAATQLPGVLDALLAEASVTLAEVDVFAVAVGPGSFTGLRVGIACMQGLAFAHRRPLVGVSALEALARLARGTGSIADDAPRRVATWVDAWRGEVYAAVYEAVHEGLALVEGPTVEMPSAVLDRLATAPTLFIGDGVGASVDLIRAQGQAHVIAPVLAPPLAATIAEMAREAARAGRCPPPHAITPLYVRRPGAERVRVGGA